MFYHPFGGTDPFDTCIKITENTLRGSLSLSNISLLLCEKVITLSSSLLLAIKDMDKERKRTRKRRKGKETKIMESCAGMENRGEEKGSGKVEEDRGWEGR